LVVARAVRGIATGVDFRNVILEKSNVTKPLSTILLIAEVVDRALPDLPDSP
jgi:hypothetical protein